MKKRTIITIVLSAALMPLASCSLFTKTVKTEAQLPTDRETIVTGKNDEPFRSKALERGEITGEWAVISVAGHEINSEIAPYLMFEPKSGRVYGNNGCNTINGGYEINPTDSTLHFSNLITTMRMCAEGQDTEREVNEAIGNTRKYSWSFSPELSYTISLMGDAGNTLMVLQHQDFNFLNGTWRVASIKGVSQDDPDLILVFDITEQKIHGKTGCNILNGTIAIDMGERNSLSIQNMATTKMACPDESVETAMLVALEEVMYARPVNARACQLTNGQGEIVLALVRVENTSAE